MRDLESIASAVLAPLDAERARRQAEAQALRDEIARLLATDKGTRWGTAHRIRMRMGWRNRPSLRTVQRHIAIIRAAESACRDA